MDKQTLLQKQENLKKRSQILKAIRLFFEEKGFLEVETPSLTFKTCCEPYIDYFETVLRDDKKKEKKLYLIPSPEIYLKKLVGAGYSKIFEISRSFRNSESLSSLQHQPEFLMLEWYRNTESYESLQKDIQDLFRFVLNFVFQKETFSYGGNVFHIQDMRFLTVKECFLEYVSVDLDSLGEKFEGLIEVAKKNGFPECEELDDAFHYLFLEKIEPFLGRKTIDLVFEYPSFQGALANFKEKDPRYAKRFEVYAGEMEIANGYEELCDPSKVEKRFLEFNRLNKKNKGYTMEIDEAFVNSLKDVKLASGVALGLDRFIMLMLGTKDIRQTKAFTF